MGLDKLISAIAIIACLGVATGQLPHIINAVRLAQIKLIQDSKASNWPKAILLPIRNNKK